MMRWWLLAPEHSPELLLASFPLTEVRNDFCLDSCRFFFKCCTSLFVHFGSGQYNVFSKTIRLIKKGCQSWLLHSIKIHYTSVCCTWNKCICMYYTVRTVHGCVWRAISDLGSSFSCRILCQKKNQTNRAKRLLVATLELETVTRHSQERHDVKKRSTLSHVKRSPQRVAFTCCCDFCGRCGDLVLVAGALRLNGHGLQLAVRNLERNDMPHNVLISTVRMHAQCAYIECEQCSFCAADFQLGGGGGFCSGDCRFLSLCGRFERRAHDECRVHGEPRATPWGADFQLLAWSTWQETHTNGQTYTARLLTFFWWSG